MAGQSARSGGRRSGAGRKPKSEKFAPRIDQAEQRIADRLPELVEKQLAAALGSATRTERRYEAAATILKDDVLRDEQGDVVLDRGRAVKIRVPVYPDAAPDELILVEEKVTTLEADAKAGQYLIDRILGKPTQEVEADITTGGEPIPVIGYRILPPAVLTTDDDEGPGEPGA